MKRNYTAPPTDERCTAVVRLKDGTTADCMRPRATGHDVCHQHARVRGTGSRGAYLEGLLVAGELLGLSDGKQTPRRRAKK